jgi:hypothetical protein
MFSACSLTGKKGHSGCLLVIVEDGQQVAFPG